MKMLKKPVLIISSLMLLVMATFGSVSPVSAQQPKAAQQFAICGTQNFLGFFPPWYACLPGAQDGEPRIERLEQLLLILFPLVESLVKIGAIVAASFIFYALFNMILARGNIQKIGKAVETIRDAVIGFVICLIAVAIVNYISGRFTVLPPG